MSSIAHYLNRVVSCRFIGLSSLTAYWARQGPGASLVLLAFALIIFAVFAQEPSKLVGLDRSLFVIIVSRESLVAFDDWKVSELVNLRALKARVYRNS